MDQLDEVRPVRPPVVPLVGLGVVLVLGGALIPVANRTAHLAGYLVGVLGGMGLFVVFNHLERTRASNPMFSPNQLPRRTAAALGFACWALGCVHAYYFAAEVWL